MSCLYLIPVSFILLIGYLIYKRYDAFLGFVKAMFSDNGVPSSSRVLSFLLSLSCMSWLWWLLRHLMGLPADKLMIWIGNLPMVILALATWATSPFGIGKIGETIAQFKKKDQPQP